MDKMEYPQNRYFRRSSTKAFTDVRQTPVVLACIYNKNGIIITHNMLHSMFSAYGKILRILIFEKLKVWKAFVEYENLESAAEAKRQLDNFQLFNDGSRMNVYFSNLESIKFQNNNSGGIDYTIMESTKSITKSISEVGSNTSLDAGTIKQKDDLTDKRNSILKFEHDDRDDEIFGLIANSKGEDNENELDGRSDNEEIEIEGVKKLWDKSFSNYFNISDQPPQFKSQIQSQILHHNLLSQPPQLPQTNGTQQAQQKSQTMQSTMPMNHLSHMIPMPSHQINSSIQPQISSNIQPHMNPQMVSQLQSQIHSQMTSTLQSQYNPSIQSHINSPLQQSHITSNLQQAQSMQSQIQTPQMTAPLNHPIGLENYSKSPEELNCHVFPQSLSPNNTGSGSPAVYKTPFQSFLPQGTKLSVIAEKAVEEKKEEDQQKVLEMIERDIFSNFISKIQSNLYDSDKLDLGSKNDGESRSYQSPSVLELINDKFEKNYFEKYLKETEQISPTESPNSSPTHSNTSLDFNASSLGQLTLSDLKNLDRNALTQLYQDLSIFLGMDNNKSQVLYIRGLEHKDFRVHMLYNVFSNFGNILKIIFIRSKAAALIEFENVEYSTISKDYLNNIVFMGKPLRIYYSNYSMINLSKKNCKDYPAEDVFMGNPRNYRFKKTKNISINPPSATLHISNLMREICHEDLVRKYFSQFGRVEAVKFLFMDNNKNMCLLRMASIEESLNAMAHLHDTDIGGRKIQISFTRSKIN